MAEVKRYQKMISDISRYRSNMPTVLVDLLGVRYDFLLVFYTDLRPR